MAGTIPSLRLSVDERVLLQLLAGHDRYEDFVAPVTLTQEGLATGLGLLRNNVSRSLQALETGGLVRHRLAHVAGVFRRVRVYGLLAHGYLQAKAAETRLADSAIIWRQGNAERRGLVKDLVRVVGPPLRPLDVYLTQKEVETTRPEGSSLALEALLARGPGSRLSHTAAVAVRMIDEKPTTERFVGRDQEIAELTAMAKSPHAGLLVLQGLAGIGKSSLASRFLESRGESTNVLWHRAQPWERFGDLARPLALFSRLVAGGHGVAPRPSVGSAGEAPDGAALLAELDRGLFRARAETWVVYDDLSQVAEVEEAQRFARLLREGLRRHPSAPVKVLVLSRGDMNLFEARDLGTEAAPVVRELTGLDRHSARKLRSDLPPEVVDALYDRTGGHPLALALADPAAGSAGLGQSGRYVRDDVLSGLGPQERDLLERLAVARAPLSLAAWLPAEDSEASLANLRRAGLIRTLPGDRYDLHALVADVVLSGLPPERRKQRQAAMARQVVEAARGTDPEEAAEPDLLLAGLRLMAESGDVDGARELFADEFENMLDESPDQAMQWIVRLAPPQTAPNPMKARWAEMEGDVAVRVGDRSAARSAYRRALELERSPGPLAKLSRLDARESRWAAAQAQRDEALELYRKAGRSAPAAWLLLETGRWARSVGKPQEAHSAYSEARRVLLERPPAPASEARALAAALANNEAMLAMDEDDLAQARSLLREALEAADVSRDGPIRVLARLTAVELDMDQGDPVAAERRLTEAIRIGRDGGHVAELLEAALAADRLGRTAHRPELRRQVLRDVEDTLLRGRGGSPLPLPPGSEAAFVAFVTAVSRPEDVAAPGPSHVARVGDLVGYARRGSLKGADLARIELEWGRAAEREGMTVEAQNAYAEGRRALERVEAPDGLRIALLLGATRMSIANGRADEARAPLTEAEILARRQPSTAARREVKALRAELEGLT